MLTWLSPVRAHRCTHPGVVWFMSTEVCVRSKVGGGVFLGSGSGGEGRESRKTSSELLKYRRGVGTSPVVENMAILSLTLHSLFSSLRQAGTRTGDRSSSVANFLVGGANGGTGGGGFSSSSSISAGLPTVKGLCSV